MQQNTAQCAPEQAPREIPEHCRQCCGFAGAGRFTCLDTGPELVPEVALMPATALAGQSLAAGSLELAKVLTALRKTVFRASGTCMYPTVLPGDLLQIETRKIHEILIGEIAVFRRKGSFYGHRVIAWGKDNQGFYILTRPDRLFRGDEDPIYEQDLLGIVRCIERSGRMLETERRICNFWEQAYYSCRLSLTDVKNSAIKLLQSVLISIQQTGLYNVLAKFWFARSRRQLDFVVQAPLRNSPAGSFFRKFAGSQIDAFEPADRGPAHWTIALHVDRRPVAMLAFFRCPEECPHAGWWLSGAYTRIRYRGMGIEEKLFRKAKEILAGSKVPALKISLPKDSPELRIWEAWGFEKRPGISEQNAEPMHEKRVIVEAAIG